MTIADSCAVSLTAEAGTKISSRPPGFPNRSSQEDQPTVAPVRSDERISALETIRGFALLSILLVNVCGIALPGRAYDDPAPTGGAAGLNLLTWCSITIFADCKMRAIFSLAFGAGVYLLIDRLSRKGAATDAAAIHYRRMLWLLLFGMIRAYLIWDGDIFFCYAVMGLVLYRRRPLQCCAARWKASGVNYCAWRK
jgi:uncharacterized protein